MGPVPTEMKKPSFSGHACVLRVSALSLRSPRNSCHTKPKFSSVKRGERLASRGSSHSHTHGRRPRRRLESRRASARRATRVDCASATAASNWLCPLQNKPRNARTLRIGQSNIKIDPITTGRIEVDFGCVSPAARLWGSSGAGYLSRDRWCIWLERPQPRDGFHSPG
jgi:hypothetical protein